MRESSCQADDDISFRADRVVEQMYGRHDDVCNVNRVSTVWALDGEVVSMCLDHTVLGDVALSTGLDSARLALCGREAVCGVDLQRYQHLAGGFKSRS